MTFKLRLCLYRTQVQALPQQKNTQKAFNDAVQAGISWSILYLAVLVLNLATEKDISHDDRDILPRIRYDAVPSCDTMNCSTHLGILSLGMKEGRIFY